MWCIGRLTEEYRQRMYDLLDLYARPYQKGEPVVCLDEKSKQLLKDSRTSLPIRPGTPIRQDYEYVRAGTCNLFVAVEPKGGRRTVLVTDRRTKPDFVAFVRYLLEQVYATARRVHLVMDNLNTHFRKCFEEVLGVKGESAFAPGRFSLHPETRQLAQHGGNRNRHSGSPVSESALTQPRRTRCRGRCLAAAQKCRPARHRVVVHSAGRG